MPKRSYLQGVLLFGFWLAHIKSVKHNKQKLQELLSRRHSEAGATQ